MPADATNAIRLLSDHVCNKIAAGEVIERPASVFKELVENAVDAGAASIEIEVLQGGRKAVIVTDDGHGMDRESALLAIERHATSKIRDVDDIEHIHTMGFRGEALAAIAAVARFRLTTRRPDDLGGTSLEIEGGTLRSVDDEGCPPGTRIEVRNLFFNVPARRKFLRTEATELANIRTLFHVFAVAHPDVALRLKVDGRELERYPVQSDLRDRIADIYGDGLLDQLREIDFLQGDLRVYGFTGLPTLHRGDRRDQVTLVNRRPATAPVLGYAIREAYRDTLPRGRYPVTFLHLDMPADWVDVNVHPTKREVRFGPSHLIRDAVIHSLGQAVGGQSPGTGPPSREPAPPPPARPPMLEPEKRQREFSDRDLSYPPLPPAGPPPARPASLPPDPAPRLQTPTPAQSPAAPWKSAEVVGRVGNRFCLLETEDGLVIMDPAAARERILFERAKEAMDKQTVASQKLLVPETVACGPMEARRIGDHLESYRALGFELEPFGGDTFMVEAMPAWMGDVDPAATLKTLAEQIDPSSARIAPEKLRDSLARSCCLIAARRQTGHGPAELRALIDALARCRMPYTTPHGRPTLIHMGFNELKRKFGIEG